MSSGGGPNSEIAKLSIGIEATGVDATTQKLKGVEQQAKQTAAAVESSSMVGPGFRGGSSSITGPSMMPGGVGSVRDAAMDWSSYTVKLDAATEARQRFIQSNAAAARSASQVAEASTGLASALRPLSVFTRVAGAVGLFAGTLAQAYEGIVKYRNAASELNEELKKIGEGFKVSTTFGASEAESLRKQADAAKEAALQAEKLRMASRGYREGFIETIFGEPTNKANLQQIQTEHASALAQINVREKNQRDKDEEDQRKAREKENAEADKADQERLSKARNRALAETEDLRKQAAMATMSDRDRVLFEYEEKVKQAYQRIAETEDAAIKYAYQERITYLNQLRDAELKVIDDRTAKEAAAAKQNADAIAQAFNEAMGSALKQNQEKIAQMFDATALLQRFDGIASALETLGRQRGIR